MPVREITPEQLPGLFAEIGREVARMDFSESLRFIGVDLRLDHEGFFDREASPAGLPWKPLSPLTIAAKGHSTILVDTGEMKNSVTVKGHPNAIQRIAGNELVWGTRDPKAAKHQYGIGVPQRSFVGFTPNRVDGAAEEIATSVVEQLKAEA